MIKGVMFTCGEAWLVAIMKYERINFTAAAHSTLAARPAPAPAAPAHAPLRSRPHSSRNNLPRHSIKYYFSKYLSFAISTAQLHAPLSSAADDYKLILISGIPSGIPLYYAQVTSLNLRR